tara:strand:+ start:225 stop:725 length:501 start_codon:yes stop_codon:yes gene_type:complete
MVGKQEIQDQLKESMKEGNEVKTGALRMLLSSISNKEKEKRFQVTKQDSGKSEEDLAKESELTEEEIQSLVATEVKKRKEAKEAFEKGGRDEAAQKEQQEMELLQAFLPEQMSEQEVEAVVKEVIAETGASSISDMGKVIGIVMGKVQGKADGGAVSAIAKKLLGN